MKSVFIGQSFMIPSYAFIVAGILNSKDMLAFLILMGLACASAITFGYVGYRWVDRRYAA